MKRAHLLLCCVLALAASQAHAQIESFLQIPGIPGESTRDGRKDWIDLRTVSMNIADRVCDGVVVTKNLDLSSGLLSGAALSGAVYPTMTIEAARIVDAQQETFLKYTLESVTVQAVQNTTTATLPALETVHLFAAKITMAYTPPSTGGQSVPITFPTLTCTKK
jgi:type VI protein secretion system component Hcp